MMMMIGDGLDARLLTTPAQVLAGLWALPRPEKADAGQRQGQRQSQQR